MADHDKYENISVLLNDETHRQIEDIAASTRPLRSVGATMRDVLLGVLSGELELAEPDVRKQVRTSVRLSKVDAEALRRMKLDTGMSPSEILALAVKRITQLNDAKGQNAKT